MVAMTIVLSSCGPRRDGAPRVPDKPEEASAGDNAARRPPLDHVADSGALQLVQPDGSPVTVSPPDVRVMAFARSPNGERIAYVALRNDGRREVRMYDMKARTDSPFLAPAESFEYAYAEVSWSPAGRYLAVDDGTGASGRALHIFEAASGRRLRTLGYAYSFAWIDEDRLAVGISVPVDPPLPVEDGQGALPAVVALPDGQPEMLPGMDTGIKVPIAGRPEGRLLIKDLLSDREFEVSLDPAPQD